MTLLNENVFIDTSDTFQNGFYEFFDTRFVVGVSRFDLTLRNDAANGHRVVTHVKRQAGDTRTLHLVVRDTLSFVAEGGDLLVDIGYRQVDAQHASLRAIEAVSSNRATAHHIVFGDTVYEFGISSYYVRHSRFLRIADEVHEGFLEAEVSDLVTVVIESEYTVETDGFLRNEESAQRNVFLHTAASANTHDVEAALVLFLRAGSKVDIRQCVYLVHHDIAVVGTDTGGDTRDTLTLELTGDGMELTGLYVALDRTFVEEGSHHVHAVLVTDEDDLVGQELGFEMQMKRRAIGIDDQLRSWECFHSNINFKFSIIHYYASPPVKERGNVLPGTGPPMGWIVPNFFSYCAMLFCSAPRIFFA